MPVFKVLTMIDSNTKILASSLLDSIQDIIGERIFRVGMRQGNNDRALPLGCPYLGESDIGDVGIATAGFGKEGVAESFLAVVNVSFLGPVSSTIVVAAHQLGLSTVAVASRNRNAKDDVGAHSREFPLCCPPFVPDAVFARAESGRLRSGDKPIPLRLGGKRHNLDVELVDRGMIVGVEDLHS